MISPLQIGVGILIVISVIVIFQLRKPVVTQKTLSSPHSRAMISKTIVASEKSGVADVADALERSAIVKREETEERIKRNKKNLAELEAKKAADLIARQEAIRKRVEIDKQIAEAQRLHLEMEAKKAAEAARLDAELAERRRITEEKIKAASCAAV